MGDDLNTVVQFMAPGHESYSAAEVVASLLSKLAAESEVEASPLRSPPEKDSDQMKGHGFLPCPFLH